MIVDVLKGGFQSTIQDCGRNGYQSRGVTRAGAMDQRAYKIANILVGNDSDAPCIEMAYGGVSLLFHSIMEVGVTGAATPAVNGKPVPVNVTLYMIPGDLLEIKPATSGVYSYISFSSTLLLDKVLQSMSTDIKSSVGGFHGRRLQSGDQLLFEEQAHLYLQQRVMPMALEEVTENETVIRIIRGIEYDAFDSEGQGMLVNEVFEASGDCNRMAYRFKGPKIEALDGYDIISDGLTTGTIQVTESGELIAMLADCQPTGGYTRIGNVITVDLPKLVQLQPQSKVRFSLVSLEEAHMAMKQEHEVFLKWMNTLTPRHEIEIKNISNYNMTLNNKRYSVQIIEQQ